MDAVVVNFEKRHGRGSVLKLLQDRERGMTFDELARMWGYSKPVIFRKYRHFFRSVDLPKQATLETLAWLDTFEKNRSDEARAATQELDRRADILFTFDHQPKKASLLSILSGYAPPDS